ncbi:MAG: hypothetical protein S4CHLAM123_02570 [Chlamydiales bacterium]|nr:hypothetical protein [Chlamydiales bacterium]
MYAVREHPLNQAELPQSFSPPKISAITVVALTAVAALTVGLLGHFGIIAGLGVVAQVTLFSYAALAVFGVIAVAIYTVKHRSLCSFKNELKEKEGEQLVHELKDLFEKMSHVEHSQDPFKLLYQIAAALPVEKLESILQLQDQNLLEHAKKSLGEAKYYFETTEVMTPSVKAKLSLFVDKSLSVLDTVIATFGIGDLFDPVEDEFLTSMRSQKIFMLISLFTILTSTLLPLLGVTAGSSIVGSVLILFAAVSVLWPKIKPLPSHLPLSENWSLQAKAKKLNALMGRKEPLRKIAEALTNHKHPLLIGPSGIGKTQTVEAFVQALEKGEYPELTGKKVFYFNTANIVTNQGALGSGNKSLQKISAAMGRHRDNCILVLDEIHTAYQAKESTAIGDQLKTYLDQKPEGSFPHVIGLTTEEEYLRDIYTEHSAGDRRFEVINITSTSSEETLTILNAQILQEAPDALLSPGALEYLLEKTREAAQPLTARKLLSKCISRIRTMTSSNASDLSEIQTLLEYECSRGAVLGNADLDKIDELTVQMERVLNRAEVEKKQIEELEKTRSNISRAKALKFDQIVKLEGKSFDNLSGSNKTRLKVFGLIKFFFENSLQEQMVKQAEALQVKVVINKELIDEVLLQEAEAKERKQEALKRAQGQLAQRKNLH